jgi:hypothetical protein
MQVIRSVDSQKSSPCGDGFDTSTVALRVVGGDETGTQCLGVKLGHPIPMGYWGYLESETVKCGHESRWTRT